MDVRITLEVGHRLAWVLMSLLTQDDAKLREAAARLKEHTADLKDALSDAPKAQ